MKIAFHGAARTVTGSKHLLTLNNGMKYLLDCGMFQGRGKDTDVLNRSFGFEPSEINYLILSHAHIDHCGLIPKLVKDGFKGIIFATPATKELGGILLEDSAAIQRDDTRFINKKRAKQLNVYFARSFWNCPLSPQFVDWFVQAIIGTGHIFKPTPKWIVVTHIRPIDPERRINGGLDIFGANVALF